MTATATVTADNSGLASLNLLTDLDVDFSWDQLLNAQVSGGRSRPGRQPEQHGEHRHRHQHRATGDHR
ncbi:hypothetical protein P4123_00145 [Pseudomonas aeruginosa]|nr:hypothetical protein [Pseudomonas aeruginosa]